MTNTISTNARKHIAATVAVIAMFFGVFTITNTAQAQTNFEGLVASLLEQIAELQLQLQVLQTTQNQNTGTTASDSDSGSCLVLTRSLYLGEEDSGTNDEVSKLQRFLRNTGHYNYGTITGYYGPATMAAVKRWQAANDVIAYGSPETTGYGLVGSKTRSALATCPGKDDNDNFVEDIDEENYLIVSLEGKDVNRETYDNGTDHGIFEIELEVTADDTDVYIYQGINTGRSDSMTVKIIDKSTGNSSDGILTTTFLSTGGEINGSAGQYYVIEENSTETLTIQVNFEPERDGEYRAVISRIPYRIDLAKGELYAADYSVKTDYIELLTKEDDAGVQPNTRGYSYSDRESDPTLYGSVDLNDENSAYIWFEWTDDLDRLKRDSDTFYGLNYSNKVRVTRNKSVSQLATIKGGFVEGRTYYYRINAEGSEGRIRGGIKTFVVEENEEESPVNLLVEEDTSANIIDDEEVDRNEFVIEEDDPIESQTANTEPNPKPTGKLYTWYNNDTNQVEKRYATPEIGEFMDYWNDPTNTGFDSRFNQLTTFLDSGVSIEELAPYMSTSPENLQLMLDNVRDYGSDSSVWPAESPSDFVRQMNGKLGRQARARIVYRYLNANPELTFTNIAEMLPEEYDSEWRDSDMIVRMLRIYYASNDVIFSRN